MLSFRESFRDSGSALTAHLRGPAGVHSDHLTTSLFRFVRRDRNERCPADIADGFGEMRVAHHPSDTQFLEFDLIETSDQIVGDFVMEIRPATLDRLMLLRQKSDGFPAPFAVLPAAGNPALCRLQLAFGLLQMAGIFNPLTRGQRGEHFDAEVDPDRLAGFGERFGRRGLNRENDIPAISLSPDRTPFDLPSNRSRKTDANRADFRQPQFVAFEAESGLRVGEGVIPILAFESRVARRLTVFDPAEECLEGSVRPLKYVLQDLGMDLFQIGAEVFDGRQLGALKGEVNRDAVDSISLTPLLDGSVVQFPANIECPGRLALEVFIGFEFELVGFHRETHRTTMH